MLQIPLPEVRRSEAVQNVSEQKQKIRAVKGRDESRDCSEDFYVKPSLFRASSERSDDGGGDGSDGLLDHTGHYGWGRIIDQHHHHHLHHLHHHKQIYDLCLTFYLTLSYINIHSSTSRMIITTFYTTAVSSEISLVSISI